MGLYANYPIALAPGMSLNAYFTYSVCLGMHIPWQTALGVVFFSGVLFVLLTVSRVREQIVNGIPDCAETFDGCGHRDVHRLCRLEKRETRRRKSGNACQYRNFRRPRSAGRVLRPRADACLDRAEGQWRDSAGNSGHHAAGDFPRNGALAHGAGFVPHPSLTFLKFDLRGALHLGLFEIMFMFLFVDLLDNVGTLVGVCEQAGFVKDGKIPRVGRALLADAVGTVFGSMTGTSTITSYIESAAGVAAGARTGLSNILVAALFLAAMFFAPVATAIPGFATAPALILVGALMMQSVARVKWDEFSDAFPAFVTIACYSAHFQHRHRPEPWSDFLHRGENCRRKNSRDQSAALDSHRAFHSSLRLPRRRLDRNLSHTLLRLLRIDYAAEPDRPCSIPSRRHQQILLMFVEAVSLREIPDRAAGLVERSPRRSQRAYARREIRLSTARCCLRDQGRRTDSLLACMRSRLSVRASCDRDREAAAPARSIRFPTDKSARQYLAPHIATPSHLASACRPTRRMRAHPRSRPM